MNKNSYENTKQKQWLGGKYSPSFYSELLLIEDSVAFLTSSLLSCCVNIPFWTLHRILNMFTYYYYYYIHQTNCKWKKKKVFSINIVYFTSLFCNNLLEWNVVVTFESERIVWNEIFQFTCVFRKIDHSIFHFRTFFRLFVVGELLCDAVTSNKCCKR